MGWPRKKRERGRFEGEGQNISYNLKKNQRPGRVGIKGPQKKNKIRKRREKGLRESHSKVTKKTSRENFNGVRTGLWVAK